MRTRGTGTGRRAGGLAALGVAAALFAACDAGSSARSEGRGSPETERRGGTAVVGGREPVSTLNPLTATDYVAHQLQRHVLFLTLVRADSAQRPVPYLARSWETNADTTEITFHLRSDARWHDGTPTTAGDVAFTFRAARDPEVPFPNRSFFDQWEEVEVVDDTTVRFTLRPHPGFLFGWTATPIAPRHLLEGVPPAELGSHPFGTASPVGNGPFRFVERRGTDVLIFEANPDFSEALGGRPYLDRLVYRVVPDPTTLMSELRGGGVHYYVNVPPGQVERIETDAATRVVTFPSRTVTFIAWNTRRPPFTEAAVRRAITMGVDRDQLLAAVRNGLGVVATGPVGPWHWAHDPSWRPLPYAPDSARALLSAAGWRDPDRDGVREREGEELRFELLYNENPVRQEIAVILQGQLGRVGVAVEPRLRETASLAAAVTSAERAFDGVILAFTQSWILDDRDQWACARRDQPFHFSGLCSAELDAVLDSIPLSGEPATRERLYRRYHETIAREQPYTYLFYDVAAAGLRRELHGARPDARGDLVTAREWWLERAARQGPAAASPTDRP